MGTVPDIVGTVPDLLGTDPDLLGTVPRSSGDSPAIFPKVAGSSRGGHGAAREVEARGENVSTASQLSVKQVKASSEARQIRRFQASR